MRARWPLARTVVLTPRATIGADWWAEPRPSAGDVAFYARTHDGRAARELAYRWTTRVDTAAAVAALRAGRGAVSPWRRLVVVGFSNGCVPATDLAAAAGARSLWLASGLPGNHQAWAALARVPRRVATVAFGESYWGGCARVATFLARDGGFHVLKGMYHHAREDTRLGVMAAALARL